MGRFAMWAALVAACGKVAELPAPPAADAALDAFACAASMQQCGATCVDTTSDPMNCGGCGITCQAGVESCQAGVCVSTIATCADIAADNPKAADGQYTLIDGTVLDCDLSGRTCAAMRGSNISLPNGTYQKTDGTTLDCDMQDGGLQIIGLAWGAYNGVTPGYTLISLADFQNTVLQQFFIKYYNSQNGAALIAAFQSQNCCFRYDSTGSNTLLFGANFIYPDSLAGASQCNATPASYGAFEAFSFEGSTPELPPLGSGFFTANAPSSSAVCAAPSTSPAFFWKVMQ